MYNQTSEKKQKLIDEYLQEPIKVGDYVSILGDNYRISNEYYGCHKVIKITETEVFVKSYQDKLYPFETVKKLTFIIGANPFSKFINRAKAINYDLGNILSSFGLLREDKDKWLIKNNIFAKNIEFNPYIYDNDDKKVYYQREFVWSIEQCQLLIESIYNNISCGVILVRLRSWEELVKLIDKGETEVSFRDVVDGRQRLTAITKFVNDEYPDFQGNYYSDLSNEAQSQFLNNNLIQYFELPEETKDSDIKTQFLRLNFTGVPQSKEHIEFIKSINV